MPDEGSFPDPEPLVETEAVGFPKVSIVIPVWNAASTLGATLASVLGQQHPADEVVIVDDGSIDATAEVARQFSVLLPIRVERLSTNQGVAAALDHAIRRAAHELVLPCGGDDLLLPDHVETLLRLFQRQGGVVAPRLVRWIPGQGIESSAHHDRELPTDPEGWLAALLQENFLHGGPLIRRDHYDEVGGYRREMAGAEDWDLWLRFARAGIPFTVAPNPTYLYRLAVGTLSMNPVTLAASVRVLERAVDEAASGDEAAIARRSLRRWRARRSLAEAYEAARRGDHLDARRSALRATLGGSRRVQLLGAGLVVAPGTASHVRDAIAEGRA